MRGLAAYVWIFCGAAAVGIGIYNAAGYLRGTYDRLAEDALADPGYEEREEVPRRMLTALTFGAGGLVPLAIGTVMLRRDRARRRRRRRRIGRA